MPEYKHSKKVRNEKEVARSQAYDVDVSYKDLGNVLRAIKWKSIKEAEKVLEDCISKKKAVFYGKNNTGVGHRSELGGRKGRYPIKAAKIAMVLLKNAEANANYKGLNLDDLVVSQAAAYKQNVIQRYRRYFASSVVLGYGKQATWANYMTARAEILLEKRKVKKAGKAHKASKTKK